MNRMEMGMFSLPRYRQIPDIGLLLEQTVRLVNGYLEPLGSVSITSSMVSNYVKHDIIDRAVKKQYGRDQLAYLVFIAIAKTVLSLDDIARLIELQRNCCDLEPAYDRFCEEFEAAITGRLAQGRACEADDLPAACSGFGDTDIPRLREVLCDIAAVSSMSILLRMKLEQLG